MYLTDVGMQKELLENPTYNHGWKNNIYLLLDFFVTG
jgi:hypothetical protein